MKIILLKEHEKRDAPQPLRDAIRKTKLDKKDPI